MTWGRSLIDRPLIASPSKIEVVANRSLSQYRAYLQDGIHPEAKVLDSRSGKGGKTLKDLLHKPDYPLSSAIPGMTRLTEPFVIATGDMWPITWADDDNLYAGAGDNTGFGPRIQLANLWRITGTPPEHEAECISDFEWVQCLGEGPLDNGIKPAGILSVDGVLHMFIEDTAMAGRCGFHQMNVSAWPIVSTDHGLTWSPAPAPDSLERRFFTGRFASPHFLQCGKDYAGARDRYVYAYACADEHDVANWNNGDVMYLGRVPKDRILMRDAWEFYGGKKDGLPVWVADLGQSAPVFRYPHMTSENEVVYNTGLGRYLLLNWAYLDGEHFTYGANYSELTIFEAPEPWGPWELVYRELNWGPCGDYQPRLPTKWISADGHKAWLLSAGNFHHDIGPGHYGLVVSQVEFCTGNYGDIQPLETPVQVQTVQAIPLSDTEVRVTWWPDFRAQFYQVFRDGRRVAEKAFYEKPFRFIDTGLASGTTYHYTVAAFDVRANRSPEGDPVTAVTPPALAENWLGVNVDGGAVEIDGRVWIGEDSSRIKATSMKYPDQRIQTMALTPNPGVLEPLLRSFGGKGLGYPGQGMSCLLPRPGRGLEKAEVWVYAVNTGLCGMNASFDLCIQKVWVEAYRPTGNRHWHKLGPYCVELDPGQPLLIEGRNFQGLGGIAAIEVTYSPNVPLTITDVLPNWPHRKRS